MTTKIKDIKRFKITCLECESEFILKIGKQLYACPVCGRDFDIDINDDIFFRLSSIFKSIEKSKKAEFYLLCDEKGEQ